MSERKAHGARNRKAAHRHPELFRLPGRGRGDGAIRDGGKGGDHHRERPQNCRCGRRRAAIESALVEAAALAARVALASPGHLPTALPPRPCPPSAPATTASASVARRARLAAAAAPPFPPTANVANDTADGTTTSDASDAAPARDVASCRGAMVAWAATSVVQ